MTQAAAVRESPSQHLAHLFNVAWEFTSDSRSDAIGPADGREGAYIGSGEATVAGDRIRGTMSWSLYAGDCLYPRIL